LRPIAEALDFIHHKGYIHRDVKPANILFDGHKHPFLSDFGVAKVLAGGQTDRQGLTGVGMVIGTPEYMAPELVMGEPSDGRIDQYALSIAVYEVLSGRVPFVGPSGPAVLVKQTNETAPALREIRQTISQTLSDAVARGMAKKPADRFMNCVTFANAVLAGLDQPAARTSKPTLSVTTSKPSAETPRATSTAPITATTQRTQIRSRKGLVAVAGGASILLVAAAAGFWMLNRSAAPNPLEQPIVPQQVAANDPKPPDPIPDIIKPPSEAPKFNTKPGRPNQNKAGGKGKSQAKTVISPPKTSEAPTPTKIDDVRILPARVNLIAGGAKQVVTVEVDRSGTGPIIVELQSNAGATITPSSRSLATGFNEARFEIVATGQLQSQTAEITVAIRGADSPRIERLPVTVTRLDFHVTPIITGSLVMQPGDARDVKLTIDRSAGYRGPIQLSVEGSSAVDPSSVVSLGRDEVSATMRVRAKRNSPTGESTVTIKATATELSIVNLATVPLHIYRPPSIIATLGKSSMPITAIAMHGEYNGTLKILVGGEDGSVQSWYRPDPKRHPNDFKWGWSQTHHKKAVSALAFSPDGRQAVSGSVDGTVALWDMHTKNEMMRTFNGNGEWHKTAVVGVYFQPRGPLPKEFGFSAMLDKAAPVSISNDAGILWDDASPGGSGVPKSFTVGSRQRLARFDGETALRETVPRSKVSYGGGRALAIDGTGQLHLRHTGSNSLQAGFPWKPDGDVVRAAVLSADGSCMLIGHNSGMLKLWKLP
jgi:hypothetical protein